MDFVSVLEIEEGAAGITPIAATELDSNPPQAWPVGEPLRCEWRIRVKSRGGDHGSFAFSFRQYLRLSTLNFRQPGFSFFLERLRGVALDRGQMERAYREFPHTADAAKM